MIELKGRNISRAAERLQTPVKAKVGGVCLCVNRSWCSDAVIRKATPLPHVGCSDHLSLFLLPKYTPTIKRVKPTVKTVTVWMKEADSSLQQELQNKDRSLFASRATLDPHTDVNTYTSSVLHHINRPVDEVTTHKVIKMYPNQKPWMNMDVRFPLKACGTAFKLGNHEGYS